MGTLPFKKVNNSDPGDADHWGGNDIDDLSDAFNDVDKGTFKINSNFEIRSSKFKQKDSDNSHSYITVPGNISADRNDIIPALTGNDTRVYEAHAQTLTNKTIDADDNKIIPRIVPYKYVIYLDGSTAKCLNTTTGVIDSSSSTHDVVIQYAIDNASGNLIFIQGGLYTLTTTLDAVDKSCNLRGNTNDNDLSTSVRTTLKKNHSGHLLDMENSEAIDVPSQTLKDITLDGNDLTGSGIRANFVKRHWPFLDRVSIRNCDVGLNITNSWYDNVNDIFIVDCNTGVYMDNDGTPATLQDGINTFNFIGGTIRSCNDYNIHINVVNMDVFFGSMILENDEEDFINLIRCESRARNCVFFRCSLEEYADTDKDQVYDAGGNNSYIYMRHAKSNSSSSMTAYHFASTAQSCIVQNCVFQGVSGQNTNLVIDSGADDIQFLNNHRNRWVANNWSITDNGTDTMWWGNDNAQKDNKVANTTEFGEAKNIKFGTTTGTKIGTATTQKLGFYNATPIVQPSANADTSGATLGQLETEVNELKQTLRNLGLMA